MLATGQQMSWGHRRRSPAGSSLLGLAGELLGLVVLQGASLQCHLLGMPQASQGMGLRTSFEGRNKEKAPFVQVSLFSWFD